MLTKYQECISTQDVSELSLPELLEFAQILNNAYRDGTPLVSDTYYDRIVLPAIIQLQPDATWITTVEPELSTGNVVDLPARMLSTNKAYDINTVANWYNTVLAITGSDVMLKVTPKLDGYACYDDGVHMYTRGDGYQGTDITHIVSRGVRIVSDTRGLGPGELVVSKSYFANHLSSVYENSRNFQATIIKPGELSDVAVKAIDAAAVVFYPFSILPSWLGTYQDLMTSWESILTHIWNSVDYDVDGVVIEVVDASIKEALGATAHHHRWQIAFKRNEEPTIVEVLEVIPQTGKIGRITPVALLVPTVVSGVTISRVTAHNYGHVLRWQLGVGSRIAIVRAGLVIPKIMSAISPGEVVIPTTCPSCGSVVAWDNDHLYCSNLDTCPAQITSRLEYFFKTLGTVDGFGPATMDILHQHGISTISAIYDLSPTDYQTMGFGPRQSDNLYASIGASRVIRTPDWRLLAAFSIHGIGRSGCRSLLEHYSLMDIWDLNITQLKAIPGIGPISAATLVTRLAQIKPEFDYLYNMGFNIAMTSRAPVESTVAGLTIVFTGSMVSASRSVLETEARVLGITTASSVSARTDYLVVGDNPGASKITAATKHNTPILTEQQYLDLLCTA